MPKFRCHGTVIGSKYLGVYEAATAEEAVEKATRDAHASMCHQCASECEDPTIEDISAEEIDNDD